MPRCSFVRTTVVTIITLCSSSRSLPLLSRAISLPRLSSFYRRSSPSSLLFLGTLTPFPHSRVRFLPQIPAFSYREQRTASYIAMVYALCIIDTHAQVHARARARIYARLAANLPRISSTGRNGTALLSAAREVSVSQVRPTSEGAIPRGSTSYCPLGRSIILQ